MSGAEALVAIGLASNILQFVEFTTKLCARIQEYSSAASGLPRELSRQAEQLSALLSLLKELSQQPEGQKLEAGILQQCQFQAEEIAAILNSLQRGTGNSRWENAKVALRSLKRTQQIDQLQSTLDRLINLLSLQLQVEAKRAADRTGKDVSRILEAQSGQLDLVSNIQNPKYAKEETQSPIDRVSAPIWIVPVSRNPKFVGRESVIEQLREDLSTKHGGRSCAVLYGLGGVGKTQVALEYIFRAREPTTAVFWVYAGDVSRFADSYKRVAAECQIPGRDDPDTDTLQLVRIWLETKYQFQWLMVIDNVDDRTILFEQAEGLVTGKALIEYIPQTGMGSIIYTTRSRDIGIDLAHGAEPISVPPLDPKEGLSMLDGSITKETTEADQMSLLEELAYLPLAISQAAAFMMKRRKTIADYMVLLKNDATNSKVLDHQALHHGRESRGSESVIRTWWITFQYIKKENHRAAQLLMYMSIMNRQEIPLAVFQEAIDDVFDFEEAIGMLEAFSLITVYPSSEVWSPNTMESLHRQFPDTASLSLDLCDMHRLVQISTRKWLAGLGDSQFSIANEALGSISRALLYGTHDSWSISQLLHLHAEALVEYASSELAVPISVDSQDYGRHLDYKSNLLHNLSYYSRMQGDLRLAERRGRAALQLRQMIFPAEHEYILDAKAGLASAIGGLGRRGEACQLQREVLEGRENLFGSRHRKTLEALNQLGSTLRDGGSIVEAEKLHRRELTIKKELLKESPEDLSVIEDVVIALNNVASVLNHQGEHIEAELLLQEGIELTKALDPAWHDDWLVMESLAITHGLLGKYDDARILFNRVLSGREEEFGRTHHNTLVTRGQITSMLLHQGNNEEAAEELKALVEDEVDVLGPGAPPVWASLHNLAVVLQRQKQHQEAEQVYRRLLEYQEVAAESSTNSEPSLHSTLANLRSCLVIQGKTSEAEEMTKRAAKYEELSLSRPSSPSLDRDISEANALKERNYELYNRGFFQEAQTIAKDELELRRRHSSLGESEDIQSCRMRIARALNEIEEFAEAQALAREVLTIRKRRLGWRNTETQDTIYFLAASLRDSGALQEAEDYSRELLLWAENSYGKHGTMTYTARWSLANVISQQGRYPEAEELYRKNLKNQLEGADARPEETAQAYHNLACVLFNQSKHEEAEEYFINAYNRRAALFGESDPRTIRVLFTMADLAANQGKFDDVATLSLLLARSLELPESDSESQSYTESIKSDIEDSDWEDCEADSPYDE
ncbi:hypothetical protein ACLMJK_009670 [Lecanora helva]